MKKIIYSLIFITALNSCEVLDFNLQEDPNELSPNSANANFVLNEIQIQFAVVLNGFEDASKSVMRYITMNETYADATSPGELDSEWAGVYKIAENTKIIEGMAEKNPDFRFHKGVANILKSYAMVTLTDYLGDIPFSQANNRLIPAPEADDDESIYNNLLVAIDTAIEDIENGEKLPLDDLFFEENNRESWIKLANSLKLKMLINMGDTQRVTALINQDNLIDSANFDFVFRYTTAVEPDSRHPEFKDASYGAEGFSSYIGNYFIWLLKDSKSVSDPRLRYYIYRQIGIHPQDDTTGNFLRCEQGPIFDYCYVGDFYWGRDHGDNNSRPADGFKKATYGLYPIGGAFDEDNYIPANDEDLNDMGGAGILPILLSSYIHFLKAEAILSLGVPGDAWANVEAGIRASIEKVITFNPSTSNSMFATNQTDIDNYVSFVSNEFNAASNDQRLDIVLREYYLSSFGNSIEAYNGYRRTGYPSNLQTPILSENVPFPRTFSMPEDAVNRNASINQRPITTQVFWDTNPSGFID